MTESIFWFIMDMLDWNKQGDDEKVMAPAVRYLSKQSDEEIFDFSDIMAKLLYDIDSKKLAEKIYGKDDYFSGDEFLYTRCVALINGKDYYYAVKNGKKKLNRDLEFESILYLPIDAWSKKHKKSPELYPHIAEYSYETGRNSELWEN